MEVILPRKARIAINTRGLYPKPTQVVVENTEGREITLSKELGKMTP